MKLPAPDHPILRLYKPGHKVRLLHDGKDTFPAMLEAIRRAEKTICFETYILRPDRTGQKFANALIKRALEGVEVNLIFDSFGSIGLTESWLQPLRRAGVRILEYNPILRWVKLRKMNRRNHRKILVVDSKIGFLGGINIGDEYAPPEEGGQGWRDTHLQIEGPGVIDMQALFLYTWKREKGPPTALNLYGRGSALIGDIPIRILQNRKLRARRLIRNAYLRAIHLAETDILITNAYFLPDPKVIRALTKAVKRGVAVKIITGLTSSDVPMVGFAGRSILGKLLKNGIEVYEFDRNILHAKTAVVDGQWATVGSYNLDYRSLHHNLEINAGILDRGFGQEMVATFEKDQAISRKFTFEEWKNRNPWQKFKDWIAYRFRYLL